MQKRALRKKICCEIKRIKEMELARATIVIAAEKIWIPEWKGAAFYHI